MDVLMVLTVILFIQMVTVFFAYAGLDLVDAWSKRSND